MRFLPLLVTGILLFSFVSCSTTERAGSGDSEPETDDTADTHYPGWYIPSVTSEIDSTGFTGYAHAVAAERSEARSLSEKTALNNLKFEIDRFAESIRRELAEGSSGATFGSASFIRNLRNAVHSISAEGAEAETEFFEEGSVINSYTRISLTNSVVAERISDRINNREFNSAFRQRLED